MAADVICPFIPPHVLVATAQERIIELSHPGCDSTGEVPAAVFSVELIFRSASLQPTLFCASAAPLPFSAPQTLSGFEQIFFLAGEFVRNAKGFLV